MAKKVKPPKRETSFMMTLTKKEKELIRAKAVANGMTMSAYARFILLKENKDD